MSFTRWLLVGAVVTLAVLIAYARGNAPGRSQPLPPQAAQAPDGPSAGLTEARVVAVADGDTISLEGGERVRYLGIDTPELQHDRTALQAFAREAADRNRQLVQGRTVRLEADAEDRDHFGRLLRHVWLGDELVAARLVGEGLGFAQLDPPNGKHREALSAAQADARAVGRGLWSDWPTTIPLFLTPVGLAQPLATPGPRPGACPAAAAAVEQAPRRGGRAAAVCLARAHGRRSAGAVYLQPSEPPGAPFTVVLFPAIWADFPESPERYFDRRTLVARGRIELYDGAPELVVRQADDIRIVP